MIQQYTDEELQRELDRRVKERSRMPVPLDYPNFDKLIFLLIAELNHIAREKYVTKDFEHHVFEEALEAVFGNDVWTWWNEGYKHCSIDED